MLGVGVRPALAGAVSLDCAVVANVADVVLHSLLEVLLGATNVGFPSGLALNSVHNNGVTAVVVVGAAFSLTVLAVAFSGLKVLRYDICVDLGSDITIKHFTEVAELVVGHRNSKPMQSMLFLQILDDKPDGCSPGSGHAYTEVGCPPGILFALLLCPFGRRHRLV